MLFCYQTQHLNWFIATRLIESIRKNNLCENEHGYYVTQLMAFSRQCNYTSNFVIIFLLLKICYFDNYLKKRAFYNYQTEQTHRRTDSSFIFIELIMSSILTFFRILWTCCFSIKYFYANSCTVSYWSCSISLWK